MDTIPHTDPSYFSVLDLLRKQVWEALQERDRRLTVLHKDMLNLLSEIAGKHWTVGLRGNLLEEVPSDEPF